MHSSKEKNILIEFEAQIHIVKIAETSNKIHQQQDFF